MPTVTKPSIKELQTNNDISGFVCSVCNLKYRFENSKQRCENWHANTEVE